MENEKIIALLIDAENVSPKYIKVILDEVSMYGTPAYKRIYGDWTSVEMASWKKVLNEHNISPMQQFSYTQGKNASDSAMIIDAMDILYAKNVDGFCIVSSDSDFTRLAARLRESRMFVIGMGESKTPTAFKSACDTFKYLDVLLNMKNEQQKPKEDAARQQKQKQELSKDKIVKRPEPPKQPAKAKPEPPKDKLLKKPEPLHTEATHAEVHEPLAVHLEYPGHGDEELAGAFVPLDEIVEKVREIIEYDSDEDGYMPLSQVGVMLSRLYADFDTRNYGFSKLHKFIEYTKAFETKYETLKNGEKNLVVRVK